MPRRRTIFRRRDVAPRTFVGTDDQKQAELRRLVEGMNNRQHPSILGKEEVQNLRNVDLTVPGERKRRPGVTDDSSSGADLSTDPITGVFDYDPQGFTENMLITEGTNLHRWTGTGSITKDLKTNFTDNLPTTIIEAYKTNVGTVAFISNGTDNVFEMEPDYSLNDLGNTTGTGSDSPPRSTVMTSFRNRVWVLKDGEAFFSDAAPSDYSTAFDTVTNKYRVPIGAERALAGTRDFGLLMVGKDEVWSLNPSVVPAATDKTERISEYGCAAGNTFVEVGDDFIYLTFDGVRGLRRTEQDKLQYGTSLPLSYKLKTEFDNINWAHVTKAASVYWDNKYFIALPTGASTTNNQVWVYYPSTKGWSVFTGWNVAKWAKFKVSGEEKLYYGDATDGILYRAWFGANDDGTAIEFIEEGRQEDMGKPLLKKYSGELRVVAKPSGDYDITVSGAFDGGAYNELGTMNVGSNLITYPVTYPVAFFPGQTIYKKFPIDFYGEWYHFNYKLYNNQLTTNADDITIYETSVTAIPQEYDSEESI